MATKGINIHESKIPIEEKYMVFKLDNKATALMIPLAHIKDIDFEAKIPAGAKAADNGTFYVKSLVALDAGTATGAATGMVAGWRFTAPTSDSQAKLNENGQYFYSEFEKAILQNTNFYHVIMSDFPYPVATAGPARSEIEWETTPAS